MGACVDGSQRTQRTERRRAAARRGPRNGTGGGERADTSGQRARDRVPSTVHHPLTLVVGQPTYIFSSSSGEVPK
ncbi:hypothetical protein TYRP_008775 [Tyrophagus putrescentiae]|nr:hypothetical protein TYRP_008775 [Tyrophagus putrescentiae]